jgi:hypothetical protein
MLSTESEVRRNDELKGGGAPSLRDEIRLLLRGAEMFVVADLAKVTDQRVRDPQFRLALHRAIDDLRAEGFCEFAPVGGKPGTYARVRGEKALDRALRHRKKAVRGLVRVKHQLSTIDERDLPKGTSLDAAKARVGAMIGATEYFTRKRKLVEGELACALPSTPRPRRPQ